MKLLLRRFEFTDESTIGELLINDVFTCYTLEDVVRTGPKVYGKTAIPEGVYRVIIDYSHKYKRLMPHILTVPGFTGIRIHSGNTADHTEGCILVGWTKGKDFVGQSKDAFNALYPKIEKAFLAKEDIFITVTRFPEMLVPA
jgi:hypothetical protein